MKKTRKIKEKKLKTVSKTKGKLSLFSVLIMLALVPLVPSVIILGMVSLTITKSNLETGAKDTLYVVANNLSNYCKENSINLHLYYCRHGNYHVYWIVIL